MARSAISTLQEFSVKQGYMPVYNFYNNSNNYFCCKVTYRDLSIDGQGRNKKEAKTNAATNMLLMLHKNTILHTADNSSFPTIVQNRKSAELLISPLSQSNQTIENITIKQSIHKNIHEIDPASTFTNYVGQLQVILQFFVILKFIM